MANITIKEILSADKVSQLVDKVNFNFDQLLVNGGGPAGPRGTTGDSGPQGITGTRWFTARDIRRVTLETINDVVGNVNLPGYDSTTSTFNSGPPTQYQQQTGTSTVSGNSNTFGSDGSSLKLGLTSKPIRGGDLYLEEDSTDATKDGRVWEYDGISGVWVLTNSTIRGPKGEQGDPGTQQWNRGVDAIADDVVYLPADTGGNATKLFLGNTVTLNPDGSTAEVISDLTIKNHLPETGNSAAAMTVHVGNTGVGDRILSMTHESYLSGSSSANANSSLLGRDPLAYSNITMSSGGNLIIQGAFRANNDGSVPSVSINGLGNVVLSTSQNNLSLTLDTSAIEHKFSGGKLRVTTGDSAGYGIRIGDDQVSGTSFARFETDNTNGWYFGSASSTDKKFIVDGNIHSYNSDYYLQSTFNQTSNKYQILLRTNGQVSIGPRATIPFFDPNSALSIIGDSTKGLHVQGSNSTSSGNNGSFALELYGPTSVNDPVSREDGSKIKSSGSNSLKFLLNGSADDDRFAFQVARGNTSSVNTEALVITNNAKVGIGTFRTDGTIPAGINHLNPKADESPLTALHIKRDIGDTTLRIESDPYNQGGAEDANPSVHLAQDGSLVNAHFGLNGNAGQNYTNSSVNATYIMADPSYNLELVAGGARRLSINPAGKTTIETAFQLDIPSAASGYLLSSDGSGNATWVAQSAISSGDDGDWSISGNKLFSQLPEVGIGTSNPIQALHVQGNTALDGQVVIGENFFSSWNNNEYALEVRATSGAPAKMAISSAANTDRAVLTFNRNLYFTHLDTAVNQGVAYARAVDAQQHLSIPEIDGISRLGGSISTENHATVMFANHVNPTGAVISPSGDEDYQGFMQIDMSKMSYRYALSTYNNPGDVSGSNDRWLYSGDGTNFSARIQIDDAKSWFQFRPFNNRMAIVDFSITMKVTTGTYTMKRLVLGFAGSDNSVGSLPFSTCKDTGAGTSATLQGQNAGFSAQHLLPGTFGWRQSRWSNSNSAAEVLESNANYQASIYGKSVGNPYGAATDNGEGTGYGLNFMGWRLGPKTSFSVSAPQQYPNGARANIFELDICAPNTNSTITDVNNTNPVYHETSFYIDTVGTTFNGNAIVPIQHAQIGGLLAGGASAAATFATNATFSDIRLKENYNIIGTSASGIPIYVFSYIGEAARYIGTMAQDLLKLGITDAVSIMSNGYYGVNYNNIDIDFELLTNK